MMYASLWSVSFVLFLRLPVLMTETSALCCSEEVVTEYAKCLGKGWQILKGKQGMFYSHHILKVLRDTLIL